MSEDTNRLLGHADEADGIEEFDNPLPDWWVGLFWLTIVWAFGYFLWYHVVADRSQEKGLADEMAAAASAWPEQATSAETGAAEFAVTTETVAAGQAVFAQNCVACHGANLEGGIGPTFLDDQWIHGGHASEILNTITVGVPEKGMLAWGTILTPEQIRHVAAFVISRHSEATGRPLEDVMSAPAVP